MALAMGSLNDYTFIQGPGRLVQPKMYPAHLGVLYLMAVLERAGATVSFADLRDATGVTPSLLDVIPPARSYAFTATTGDVNACKHLAHMLKQRTPGCQTIIGGPHATYLPEDCISHFDVVARYEWEQTIGLLRPEDRGMIEGTMVSDLDSLPLPARHLVGESAFSNTLMPGEWHGTGERAAMLISSRGCSFQCAFCANMFPGRLRFRSPENVAAEVQELKERYGCLQFRDEADDLVANRSWLLRYCELLASLGMSWKGHGRSDLMTDEKAEALKAAGCVEFGLGVESADPRVLALVNKRETVEDHKQAIAILKRHGIITKVYLVMGLPGENDLTLEANKRFMIEAQPDKWTCGHFVPYPGSAIWNHPAQFKAIIDKTFNNYWMFFEGSSVRYYGVHPSVLNRRYRQMFEFLSSNEWRCC